MPRDGLCEQPQQTASGPTRLTGLSRAHGGDKRKLGHGLGPLSQPQTPGKPGLSRRARWVEKSSEVLSSLAGKPVAAYTERPQWLWRAPPRVRGCREAWRDLRGLGDKGPSSDRTSRTDWLRSAGSHEAGLAVRLSSCPWTSANGSFCRERRAKGAWFLMRRSGDWARGCAGKA